MALFNFSTSDALRIAQSTTARKADCAKRLDYYFDRSHDEARRLIAQRFSRPETFRVFSINVVRAIADKRASTYRLPPRRLFTGADQQVCEELYRSAGVDSVLKKASRYLEVCKTVMLQVSWIEATGKPRVTVLTPNILDVVAADPEHPDRVIITYPGDRADTTSYADWTASTFKKLNHRGAALAIPGNPGGLNPYGVLPFVPWHERLADDQFFIPGGDDLFAVQDAVNMGLAHLWRAVEMQSHGQAYASGISANEVLEFGPDRAIALPAGGAFGFAAPNSPIAQTIAALEFVLRQTAATYGVGSDIFDLSKVAESGSAKHAGRLDLKEVRQDQVAQARVMEARLFEVIKIVTNTHAPGTIPADATVGVDFAEAQDQLSEAEALTNAQTKVDLAIWSPVDVLMAANPDGYPDRQSAFAELLRRRDEAERLSLQL